MERQFDKELAHLKALLMRMAVLAEEMIDAAVDGLVERTDKHFPLVASHEQEVNRLQIEVDDQVVTLLAIRQPMATDLRFIVTASKISSDLERIGDQVVNISENTQYLLQQPELKPLIDIPNMAEEAKNMVRNSIDSFVKQDVLLAQAVIMNDDKVDAYKDQIFRELLTYMMADASAIKRALALILISRNLERIGDHATNIAEEVIYVVQGRDVRRPDKKKAEPALEKLH
jgi:phosphate transport system protein